MKLKKLVIIFSIINILVLTGCASNVEESDLGLQKEDTIFQVATIQSLLEGNYDGYLSFEELKKAGDVGIGTFEAADGEMIMIDDIVYQAKADGTVAIVPDSEKTPFAVVTTFNDDETVELGQIDSLEDLEKKLDNFIASKDLFYVFRINANFDSLQVRSVPAQEKPYPVLSEVVKEQSVFNYDGNSGTLIGFWCPDNLGGINVSGYHFHFISEDRTQAGHVLNLSFSTAQVSVDESNGFEMAVYDTCSEENIGNVQEAIDSVE
ncbi:acetolactate decarboxylase [Eubacteriaceae bacterium ES2]|nr:acetolactate decarboxylase [Eubacteriaceae bacterium ES2]